MEGGMKEWWTKGSVWRRKWTLEDGMKLVEQFLPSKLMCTSLSELRL